MIKFIKKLFIKSNVKDINYYKNKNFSREQLEWIELGLEYNLWVDYYANNNYSPKQMHDIYNILADYSTVKISDESKKEEIERRINLLLGYKNCQ